MFSAIVIHSIEAEVLVDEGDRLALAEAGRTMPVALAAILDRSFGRLDDPAERLDEGRFAGAVLAEQREDLAGVKVERHAAQRGDSAEPLHDVAESDQRRSRSPE